MLVIDVREIFCYRKSIWPKKLLCIFKDSTPCLSLSLQKFQFLPHFSVLNSQYVIFKIPKSL